MRTNQSTFPAFVRKDNNISLRIIIPKNIGTMLCLTKNDKLYWYDSVFTSPIFEIYKNGSICFTIPSAIVERHKLKVGSSVMVTIKNKTVTIKNNNWWKEDGQQEIEIGN